MANSLKNVAAIMYITCNISLTLCAFIGIIAYNVNKNFVAEQFNLIFYSQISSPTYLFVITG